MSENLQFLITGLSTGAVFALVGLGIVLVYQLTGVINFAQGDFVMLGALGFALLEERHIPMVPAALIAIVGTVIVGAVMNLLVVQPARRASIEVLIILTIGASITIQGISLVVVGTSPHFASPFTTGTPLHVGGAVILPQYLWVFGVTAAAVTALWVFLTRTTLGKAMRACAINGDAARICGISPARMSLLAFVLAAALGAVGGVVLAPLQAPDAGIGLGLGLQGFTAAVVGGLESTHGAVVGGLVIGVVETMAAGHLPSGYKNAVAFGILLIVLLVRPQGLLRTAITTRV